MESPRRNWGQIAALAAAGLVVLVTLLWFRCGLRGCPDVDQLKGYVPGEASIVLDRNGEELTRLLRTRRVAVPLDSLPEYVPAAFVATEDKEFWEHSGVDWSRVIGATFANVKAGGVEQGFSTITMQLARNVFPDRLPASQRTLWRKIGEIRVAKKIERRFEKKEILEMYLNQIYFGEGAWGIQAAALEYYGKPATELTLAQAATLAGLPQAPSRLNPRADREAARERRATVLRQMREQGLISEEDAESAGKASIRATGSPRTPQQHAGFFLEEVRRVLEEQIGEGIYTEGYTIRTTVDPVLQRLAEEELNRQLRDVEAGRYGTFRGTPYGAEVEGDEAPNYLQGAVVLMSAETGDVLALVGGRNVQESRYNRATLAERQPGSAFKPFVYAAALEAGYPPNAPIEDTPLRLVQSDGRVWSPDNFGDHYSGIVTLREALVHSKNVATVRIAQSVGLDRVISMAHRVGISREIPEVPSIVLGAFEITPLELAAAYTPFATLGTRAEPRLVKSVEDSEGRVVWAQQSERTRVLDSDVAFLVTDMLRDAVNRGTGTAVRAVGFRGAAAGKTGTTNNATDVWFVGYTPRLVGAVWVGFDRPATVLRGATGGEVSAPIWGRIMQRAGRSVLAGDWAPPPGVERMLVDASGAIMDPNCPELAAGPTHSEYFIANRAPRTSCLPSYDPYDTLYADTFGMSSESEAGWWARLRERLFDRDSQEPPVREDELLLDSLQQQQQPIREGVRPPTNVPPPDSLPPSRIPPPAQTRPRTDTSRTTRDTTRVLGRPTRPPPDTTGAGGDGN